MVFAPRTVAVIGASRNPAKRGYQVVKRLVEDGFPGGIYPINPNAKEIAGVPAYPSLSAIQSEIDLALIARPAEEVAEALAACGRAGVRAAVVIAVGFRESGEAGRQLEEELLRVAQHHSIRLVGPNTSGVFNTHHRLNLVGVDGIPHGSVSVLSQSGNVILGLINEARLSGGLGFASYAGLGNEADVRFHECLAVLREDPATDTIILYAEGFQEGRALLEEIRRTVPDKPVVVHKAGRSDAGSKSAASHTGALVGSFDVADAALRQAGAVSVHRSDELLPVAETLTVSMPMRGKRVAVVADGGGHATMAADALVEHDLVLSPLTDGTQAALRKLLGNPAAAGNPVDVAGAADTNPGLFAPVVATVLADPNIDGVLMVGLFGGYASRFSERLAQAEVQAAKSLVTATEAMQKPFIVQSVYAGFNPPAHAVLRRGGIPVHQSIDIAVRCLKALSERGNILNTLDSRTDSREVSPGSQPVVEAGLGLLPEHQAREILQHYEIPVAPWTLAASPDEAVAAAREFGKSVALKVVSRDLIHKSDTGGVMLDIDPSEAGKSFQAISASVTTHHPGIRMEGVLVSPMVDRGLELIVGMTRDPTFGPVLMVGLGGVMVDVIGGGAFRTLPITRQDALELASEFRPAAALNGFRGSTPNREALLDLLVKASDMAMSELAIQEFDFNPVVLGPSGAVVVDARIVLAGANANYTTAGRSGSRPSGRGAGRDAIPDT